jgi:methyltransferase-like protein/SAM-dependent methyltransferase
MPNATATTTYDLLPYPPLSFPETHLARLAAIGRIFGLNSADPARARVLDLGCGSGINLVAQAQLFPEAEFIGIDASSRQIETGREAAAAAGTDRVRLICGDVSKISDDIGSFDYIITHGIFSWVPEDVKDAILRVSSRNLRPEGISYVSYNCLPGWRMRGALRDMMLMHTAGIKDPAGKVAQAKALIRFLSESCGETTAYGAYLRQELGMLSSADDSYIAHEFLDDENDALYFTDFLGKAGKHGLSYLGDADVSLMVTANLPPRAAETLTSLNLDLFSTEQYMDFVRNRTFRSTLLCHDDRELSRTIDPARIDSLQVGSFVALAEPARPGKPALFTGAGGVRLSVPDPAHAYVFERVAALGPEPRPVARFLDEIVAESAGKIPRQDAASQRAFAARVLLQGYLRRILDLTVGPLLQRNSNNTHPETLPLARWQAKNNHRISSQRLVMFNPDALVRKFIVCCDGTRDRSALIEALTDALVKKEFRLNEDNRPVTDPARARFVLEQIYDSVLENLRSSGLLLPPRDRPV